MYMFCYIGFSYIDICIYICIYTKRKREYSQLNASMIFRETPWKVPITYNELEFNWHLTYNRTPIKRYDSEQDWFILINVHRFHVCRSTPIDINGHLSISIDVDRWQSMTIDIDRDRSMWIDSDRYRSVSINVYIERSVYNAQFTTLYNARYIARDIQRWIFNGRYLPSDV